jgi:uncharacterized membrane protein
MQTVVSVAMKCLALLALVLVAASCGGTTHSARTVTFSTGGAFPTATIVGRYSAAGCTHDSRVVAGEARLFYEHSTTAPGPADLYYYDMRFAYAHFQADGCTSTQLGNALRALPARQRTWLLHNLSSTFRHVFSTALAAA